MGYELNMKLQLEGANDTFLEGLICEVTIEELCDDSSDPEDFGIDMKKMLDTEQAAQAKKLLGSNGDKFCKVLTEALKQYPYFTK